MPAHFENFCLQAGPGIRVAYSTPRLLASLSAARRAVPGGRIVLALTANPYYALHGARPGMRLDTVRAAMRLGRPFHVGVNDWYLVPAAASTGVLEVRDGIIDEVGIADKRLTRDRRAQARFLAGGV